MGRTNPTYRDALRGVEERWSDYRRALRRDDRERFDRLLTHARDRADAGGNLDGFDPVVPVLLSVAIGQAERIDDLETRVGGLETRDGNPGAEDDAGSDDGSEDGGPRG